MDLREAEEILEELLPTLETLEAQSWAGLQFLKDKGIADDEQFAPYLEQARNASNVRWRAARLRINRLLMPAFETTEKSSETKHPESKKQEGRTDRGGQQQTTQAEVGEAEVGEEGDKAPVKRPTAAAETTNQNTSRTNPEEAPA